MHDSLRSADAVRDPAGPALDAPTARASAISPAVLTTVSATPPSSAPTSRPASASATRSVLVPSLAVRHAQRIDSYRRVLSMIDGLMGLITVMLVLLVLKNI